MLDETRKNIYALKISPEKIFSEVRRDNTNSRNDEFQNYKH